MARAVALVPGLHTSRKEANAWAMALGGAILKTCPDVDGVHVYSTGWIGATAVAFPGLGRIYRRRAVTRFQRWVAGIQRRYGADATLDAVAYSWGTYLVGHSMSDAPGPRAFYGNVVLMGSILSSRDDWSAYTGHYARALNLYSREDEVVRFSTFGQSGAVGFTKAPDRVRQQEFPTYEHGRYEEPGPAWDAAAEFLAAS